MKKFRLMTSQCMGIFYRNFKLNKLLLIFMVVFLGIEYINLRTQKSYTSVAVLVVLAMFLTTFQSIIIINFANDRSNGFLDLYASMGLLKTPYILCQLISFALIHLIMQILIYLVYYLYYNRLDSLLPGKPHRPANDSKRTSTCACSSCSRCYRWCSFFRLWFALPTTRADW